MPHSISGFWSSLRSVFSDVNLFGQGSDFSTFDHLEERVRELEQEIAGLKRELAQGKALPLASGLELGGESAPRLYRQILTQWPRQAKPLTSEQALQAGGAKLDAAGAAPLNPRRSEFRGHLPIEAASPLYEVNRYEIAPRCCG